MKTIIVAIGENFSQEQRLIKRVCNQLSTLLELNKASVEIFLVGDSFMKKNVLSFPAPHDFPRPDLPARRPLGEIYLNPVYIRAHREDLVYMLVHGILHLLGYNHKIKQDRLRMETKERELMANLKNGIKH